MYSGNRLGKCSFSRGWRLNITLSVILLTFNLAAASDAAADPTIIDLTQVRQRIDGFGASSAFFGLEVPEDDAEFLFSEETGIGLSLLRVRIGIAPKDPETGDIIGEQEPQTEELETARQAFNWGAKVWASSWTPPESVRTIVLRFIKATKGR